MIWELSALSYWQMEGNDEWWHVNLGKMPPGASIHYLFEVEDGSGAWNLIPSNGIPYSASVASSTNDTDSDNLPDDWEQFWFSSLSYSATDNPDSDGLSSLPVDNFIEYCIGSDPAYSNAVANLRLLWYPSRPFKGGYIKLSAHIATNEALYGSSITATIDQNDGSGTQNVSLPLASNGRFENSLQISSSASELSIIRLTANGSTNDNHTLGWTIPLRTLAQGETADSDSDGLPDAWEIEYNHDPLDDGTLNLENGIYADEDGDGLTSLAEYQNGTHPFFWDTNGDGIDDASSITMGLDPLAFPTNGIDRRWLYHASQPLDPMTERIPGLWQRFLMVDNLSGTNTVFLLAPKRLSLTEGATAQVGARISWQTPGGTWSNVAIQGVIWTTTIVSADQPFHGLPTLNSVTLDVFRVDWPQPPHETAPNLYYAPYVVLHDGGTELERVYLLDRFTTNDCPTNGFVDNNWQVAPQYIGTNSINRDYRLWHDTVGLRNGGFELGGASALTNIPFWSAQYSISGGVGNVQSALTLEGTWALFLEGTQYYSIVHQDMGAQAGNEYVFGVSMLTPEGANSLSGEKKGVVALEFYDGEGRELEIRKACLVSSNAPGVWHAFELSGQAPTGARWISVKLKPEGFGTGSVFYDGLSLEWKADSDSDGIPDYWEVLHGLDPDDPWDALADPDGDALINVEEYRHQSDPYNPDSSGDGLFDGQKAEWDLDPACALDAAYDDDDDELDNAAELMFGVDPRLADTDGDGLPDGLEALDLGASPLTPDPFHLEYMAERKGIHTTNTLGAWQFIGNIALSTEGRAWAEYTFHIPVPGIYRIEAQGASDNFPAGVDRIPLVFSLNDKEIGRAELISSNGATARTGVFMPWVSAGDHRIGLLVDRASKRPNLRLDAVRLQRVKPHAPPHEDWQQRRLVRQEGIETPSGESHVSPLFVEGRSAWPDLIGLSSGVAAPAPNRRWYANIPLAENESTELECSFQNGGLSEERSFTWIPLNILEANGEITLRTNDALRLTVLPDPPQAGQATIQIGGTIYTTELGQAISHAFTQTGTWEIAGLYSGGGNTVLVSVVSAELPENPALWVDHPRIWSAPSLPEGVVLEHDLRMTWKPDESEIEMQITRPVERQLLVRLAENGPALDRASVQGFNLRSTVETWIELVEIQAEGDYLFETGLVGPVPSDLTVRLRIFVGGVFFEDGLLEKTLTANDFDDLGRASVRFLRAPGLQSSFCHVLEVWQNGQLVGIR